MSAAYRSRCPSCSTTTAVTAVPAGFVSSRTAFAFGQQRDVRVLERRPHADHLRVRLRVHEAREAVAGRAAYARAVGHVRLVEQDAARRVERMVARPRRGRRRAAGSAARARPPGTGTGALGRRLGRILAARAVHLVQLLGLRVVRLQLVVRDRPRRRDPVVMVQLAEVLLAESVERRAVELRRAADEVVDLRLERRAACRRTTCPARRSGCPRTRPARASSAAPGAANRRARGAGSACPTVRDGGRACRRRRRCR